MTTCGTPTGYTNGCRGEAECANHRTGRMTCAEAIVRYAGDYAYRKAVDAGTATDEREKFAREKRQLVKRTKHTLRETVPPVRRSPRHTPKLTPTTVHGKRAAYQAGCRDRDTCPALEGAQCPDAQLAYSKLQNQRRAA